MAPVPDVQSNMQERLDKFAILLSGLCAIHCIALPIFVSILPLLSYTTRHGNHFHEFWFHQFILIFIVPVSLLAIISGYKTHRKLLPAVISMIGLIILAFVATFAEQLLVYRVIPPAGETLLTLTGGVIHALGHLLNVQATRKKQRHCHISGKCT